MERWAELGACPCLPVFANASLLVLNVDYHKGFFTWLDTSINKESLVGIIISDLI